ncbi:MAG: hypothetical protein AAFY91_11010 [Bacteroidota bacterium]
MHTEIFNRVEYVQGEVTEAILFAEGIIATNDHSEFNLMFSPDGRTVYFSRRAPEEKQKIYESTFSGSSWTEPVVCSFSTDRDEAPSITPDGNFFFFGSERAIPGRPNLGGFDMNIWMMEKLDQGWSEPIPLPYPINDVQIEGEDWPSSNSSFFSAIDNEHFYYCTMNRGTNAIKLYGVTYRDGSFSSPEEISGLFDEEKYWIYSPVVSPDGDYLFFNSFGAPGGSGGEDIFVSKRLDDGWSKAQPIGPKVNSIHEESSPRLSRDGKYFFFSRADNLGDYEYGEWSIYFIETEALGLDELVF